MKKAGNLLETILDLGEELLKAGAEVWRTEELLGELFETYCFKKYHKQKILPLTQPDLL